MKAGFGKALLTPPPGVELAGFAGEGRTALGVHDELYARALLLQNEGEDAFCLVQTDLLDIDDGFAADIRAHLAPLGLLDNHIFVGAIHTHSGPKGTNKGTDPFVRGMRGLMGGYDETLCRDYLRAIAEAVAQARQNLCLCSFRYGTVNTEGIATNRTDRALPGDPALLALEGWREDGQKLLLYSLACHPTVMNWENRLVSADLPGGVAALLEGGEYAQVMFLNGSAGDISTRFTKTAPTFEEVGRLAQTLAGYIGQALDNARPLATRPARATALHTAMQVKALDSVPAAGEKLTALEKELAAARREGRPDLRLYESRVEGAQSNLSLSQGFAGVEELPIEVRLFRLGTLVFVFVPGELFSALSNPLRAEFGPEVVFCSYFGGYQGYIADEEAYNRGTYEALSSPYEAHQGRQLMEQVRCAILSLK